MPAPELTPTGRKRWLEACPTNAQTTTSTQTIACASKSLAHQSFLPCTRLAYVLRVTSMNVWLPHYPFLIGCCHCLYPIHRTPCLTCMNSRRFWKMQHFLAMVCRYSPTSLHWLTEGFYSMTGYVWNRNCLSLSSSPGTQALVMQALLSAIHPAPLSRLISALVPILASPPPSSIRYSKQTILFRCKN